MNDITEQELRVLRVLSAFWIAAAGANPALAVDDVLTERGYFIACMKVNFNLI